MDIGNLTPPSFNKFILLSFLPTSQPLIPVRLWFLVGTLGISTAGCLTSQMHFLLMMTWLYQQHQSTKGNVQQT